MAIDLRVDGKTIEKMPSPLNPWRWELSNYSTTEDSTPIDGGDSSGGTGQITFAIEENRSRDGSQLLLNRHVEIEDGSNGRVAGTVTGVAINSGVASITADSLLGKLVVEKQVQPYIGTLAGAFEYYLSLAGIGVGEFFVDTTIASRSVVFPGWFGGVWDFLKQLCVAQQVEISEVSSLIVMRPLRGRVLTTQNDADITWNTTNSQLARSIEIYNYNSEYKTNGLVYPTGGWNSSVQIYQIDAGETLEIDVAVDVSLISVLQPTVQNSVDRNYVGPTSVYAVAGNDGLPIPAAQWTDGGGNLEVRINDDRKSLTLVITGARETEYAPYRLAMGSGDGTFYSSIRIMGAGVFWNKELLTFPTGVDLNKSAVDVGITIDSPFVDSLARAYAVGLKAAQRYAAPVQTISVAASVVNRRGEVGNINLPPFSVFDAANVGVKFTGFNATWAGKTFADFTAYWFAQVADTFENQAFGNVGGARVLNTWSYYRVRNATITPGGINYSAEADTTFSDFTAVQTGQTFAQFNANWLDAYGVSHKFEDLTVQPLRGPN